MKVPSRNISGIKRSISPCEPSHQTILAGFVRRADSSTQLSNGVDTEPPCRLRGEHRPTASQRSGSGGTEALSNKNCRARSPLNATGQPPGVYAPDVILPPKCTPK